MLLSIQSVTLRRDALFNDVYRIMFLYNYSSDYRDARILTVKVEPFTDLKKTF